MKPIIKYCWDCGKKLRGNHFRLMVAEGHGRTFHKECANRYVNGWDSPEPGDQDFPEDRHSLEE